MKNRFESWPASIRSLAAVSAAVALAGAVDLAYAGDACKNVRFQLVNQRAKNVVVHSVDYHNDVAANNPKHEKIFNSIVCYAGKSCISQGDNLTDAEGENLSNFVFYFHEVDGNGIELNTEWHTQPKIPNDKRCTANRTYGDSKTNPWTIN